MILMYIPTFSKLINRFRSCGMRITYYLFDVCFRSLLQPYLLTSDVIDLFQKALQLEKEKEESKNLRKTNRAGTKQLFM